MVGLGASEDDLTTRAGASEDGEALMSDVGGMRLNARHRVPSGSRPQGALDHLGEKRDSSDAPGDPNVCASRNREQGKFWVQEARHRSRSWVRCFLIGSSVT